ncbi:MAG: sigma-70 family RNA polymerase sigma factor [Acidobacteria bacterium]|nr:sigma-70 family RNA polymerase sigma factor [Acidobacteriota bacterium]
MTGNQADIREKDAALIRAEIARTVRKVCPSAIAGQADDIAQDVLLRLLERDEVDPARPASYWRKAAYHAVIDEIRRRRRRREEPLGDPGSQAEPTAPFAHDPEQRATGSQVGEAITYCVRRLRDTRRLPVVLFLQGHSVQEAAALLGWEVKRAESGLYRGLKDLRVCLARKGWSR